MATTPSILLRAVRRASLASRAAVAAASRAAVAAASRAAAMASRSAGAAGVGSAAARAARPTRGEVATKPRDGAPSRIASAAADYAHLSDDAKTPTDKDLESDEALRSLYKRWCKAFNKERDQRDHVEMDRRLKLFRYSAKYVHYWNTFVPEDPEEAAIYLGKKREAASRLSKGEEISHFDECHLPIELGAFADGGDPYFNERDMSLLKAIEEPNATVSLFYPRPSSTR